MIVATAGHVDHGKTALVRALTGLETDTLDEEIQRGLSINLGYAYLPATQTANAQHEAIGFIDVPGHRRFINTMISGISGIDMGLLVVAADDGPMPLVTLLKRAVDLKGSEIIELRSDFLPAPGIDAMSKKGFLVWTEEAEPGKFRTYFRKPID